MNKKTNKRTQNDYSLTLDISGKPCCIRCGVSKELMKVEKSSGCYVYGKFISKNHKYNG